MVENYISRARTNARLTRSELAGMTEICAPSEPSADSTITGNIRWRGSARFPSCPPPGFDAAVFVGTNPGVNTATAAQGPNSDWER